MGSILEDYRNEQLNKDKNFVDEQVEELSERDTKEFKESVDKMANKYSALDMNTFIERIGGMEKIEEMKKINATADNIQTMDGRIVKKKPTLANTNEDLEEWKRGFMDGFEEAYKRIYGGK